MVTVVSVCCLDLELSIHDSWIEFCVHLHGYLNSDRTNLMGIMDVYFQATRVHTMLQALLRLADRNAIPICWSARSPQAAIYLGS